MDDYHARKRAEEQAAGRRALIRHHATAMLDSGTAKLRKHVPDVTILVNLSSKITEEGYPFVDVTIWNPGAPLVALSEPITVYPSDHMIAQLMLVG